MDNRLRLHRRKLIAALALAAVPRTLPGVARESTWQPSDGLRLAGSVSGLETLDPALSRDMQTNFLVRQVARGLMSYDEELLPIPELAASVDVSEDQTVYTFTLRDDARFHDGRTVDPEDIGWTFSRALHPSTSTSTGMPLAGTTFLNDIAGAGEVLAGDADTLAGVQVLDERICRITLDAPSTTFLMRLASVPASILDRFQDTSEADWWTRLNGSGPYRIESLDPSSMLEIRAVDSWKGDELVVRDVAVRLGLDASAPENLLQNGAIDLLDDVYAPLVPLLQDPATGLGGYLTFETSQFALSFIAFGGRQEPLDDIHVRRALQLAFDVPTYVSSAVGDSVMVPEGVIPQGVLGRAWRIDMPAASLDAARSEIAASRYGSAEAVPPIRVHAADVTPIESLRDALSRDLGLQIEAVEVNWSDFLDGLSAQQWDAYSVFWGMDYPDPEALLRMLWESGSIDNYTGYRNDAYDGLLEESRREADDVRRQALYMEAQQMLIDDVALIPLYVPRRYTIARPGFTHVPVTALGLQGLERVR